MAIEWIFFVIWWKPIAHAIWKNSRLECQELACSWKLYSEGELLADRLVPASDYMFFLSLSLSLLLSLSLSFSLPRGLLLCLVNASHHFHFFFFLYTCSLSSHFLSHSTSKRHLFSSSFSHFVTEFYSSLLVSSLEVKQRGANLLWLT